MAGAKMKLRILLNILLLIVVLVVAGLLTTWLLSQRREPVQRVRDKPVPTVVAPPIRPRLNERVEIVGYGSARPRVRLTITPQVTGVVVDKAPNFLSGKYVRKDQVLFRIDRTDYRLAERRAERRVDLLKAQLARLSQEEKNLTESQKIEAGRVELAKDQLDKAVRLLKAGAGSENEVDVAREALLGRQSQLRNILNLLALIGPQRKQLDAEIASAQVDLDQAGVNLDRCTVRSPVSGLLLDPEDERGGIVQVGQLVQAGGDCGQIHGTDIMEVPTSVPATDIRWLDEDLLDMCRHGVLPPEEARRIRARVEWRQSKDAGAITWEGFVERLEAGLEARTRTATLVVRVENPRRGGTAGNPAGLTGGEALPADTPKPSTVRPGRMLKVNMSCTIIIFGRKIPKVYVLPRQAVLPDDSVYVVVKGQLRKRPVKVARFTGREALILPGGGIRDGDRVVIGTVPRPVIGMRVKPVDSLPSRTSGAIATNAPATAPKRVPKEQ